TAIARAEAKDPRILILDDAMSAVDTYTESEILRRLRGVLRERTSIIVAHRISTVKDADEILVLDEGRVAERGTHRDLLERNGIYAQMYRRQLLEEELDVDTEKEEHERRVKASEDSGVTQFRTRLSSGGMGEDACWRASSRKARSSARPTTPRSCGGCSRTRRHTLAPAPSASSRPSSSRAL